MTRSLLFCLCLALATGLSAQNDIRFGFQLSPTFSWMNTNDNQINSDGANLGLKMGLLTEFYFRENYSIATGINFHFNAGGTLFYENTFETVDIWNDDIEGVSEQTFVGGTAFKYELQFVEIPFGLTLRTREFGYLRYYFQPLITLGIVTQSRGSVTNFPGVDSEESFDIGSAVNALNMSWGLGGGVEYSISDNTALVGGIAFQSGFADMTQDKNTTVMREGRSPREDDSRGKINSIVIRLGILF
ncbi:MAG: porin family protein [Bacteroidota bacterium]